MTPRVLQAKIAAHQRWLADPKKAPIKPRGNFTRAALAGVDLSGLDLRRAIFTGANLRGANFSNTDLRGAVFVCADLSNADLRGADLSNTDMRGAVTDGAKF